MLFAGLLAAHGQKGPAEIPAKRMYTFKHVMRLAHDLGVTIAVPKSHPFNPLTALRLACLPLAAPLRNALIDALWCAVWADGGGIEDEAVLRSVLTRLGHDPDALLAQARTDEVKATLRANTDDAIARGVFGVPSMRVGDEVFWGVDSLDHVEAFLEGRDPIDPALVERVRSMRATAHRRGSP